jgi:hypothetical protein
MSLPPPPIVSDVETAIPSPKDDFLSFYDISTYSYQEVGLYSQLVQKFISTNPDGDVMFERRTFVLTKDNNTIYDIIDKIKACLLPGAKANMPFNASSIIVFGHIEEKGKTSRSSSGSRLRPIRTPSISASILRRSVARPFGLPNILIAVSSTRSWRSSSGGALAGMARTPESSICPKSGPRSIRNSIPILAIRISIWKNT